MQRTFSFRAPQPERHFVMDDFDGRDFVVATACDKGFLHYENPLPQLLISCLSLDGGPFIDVGANTGLYTLMAAAVSRAVHVIAFEPMTEAFASLEHNVQLNEKAASQITLVKAALSGAAGTMQFYETINDMGFLSTSSTLELDHAKAIGTDYRMTEVAAVTLDAWSAAHGVESASLIKIDAEGHEQSVIEGGRKFLAKVRPIIVVELLQTNHFPFFREFVADFRYQSFILGPDFVKMEPSLQFAPQSWNHVLCPVEKVYSFVVAAKSAGLDPR
jgi:FkbM family methyltransferase